MTNIHAVDDDMYDDDDIYLGPDRCVGDRSWTDSWDREHEASCPERGVLTCCGEWWCGDCIDDHRDAAHGCWCEGTGLILFDGSMVPCTVCD